MIKQQLCAQTSRETGYSLDEIEEVLNTAISIILRTLSTSEAVKLSDFGRFSLSPSGRLVFHPYLKTKAIISGKEEPPAEPSLLYRVRRSRVKEQFKVEPVAEVREIRRISTTEPERVDYGELVED